jgi:hypothetical protein
MVFVEHFCGPLQSPRIDQFALRITSRRLALLLRLASHASRVPLQKGDHLPAGILHILVHEQMSYLIHPMMFRQPVHQTFHRLFCQGLLVGREDVRLR